MWAVDEAIDRDVPLQLLYAIESVSNDPDDKATEAASAENAVQEVLARVESTGKPVKLEADIVHRYPVTALVEASRSAALLCVGSAGFVHATQGRLGSTAAAVAASAHCPMAIVPATAGLKRHDAGLILAVVDGSPADNTVLEHSVAEARLRAAPVRVFRMPHAAAVPGRSRDGVQLEHRFTHWRRNLPDLDIQLVPEHDGLLNYLEHLQRAATPVQLVVVDPLRPGPLDVLLAPSGRAALDAAGCTVMVCDRKWWL
ncbi:universal stress protein [Mycobacterium branderi]|nr:universal stress protein [Mycobacterium branderi]